MAESEKRKAVDRRNRNIVIGASVLAVTLVIFLIAQLITPGRSVASYCEVYKEEKARLAKLPGDTWPAGIFNDELSDAGEIATSMGRLEKVAPDEISLDIKTLKSIYQKIDSDPSQAISASLSGVSAESNVKEWTKRHCNL